MKKNYIKLRPSTLSALLKFGSNVPWGYAVLCHLSDSKGWINKSEFMAALNISRSAKYRLMSKLISLGCCTQKGLNLIVPSKYRLNTENESLRIGFDEQDLESAKQFNTNMFLQSGLIVQNRFRHAHRKSMRKNDGFQYSDLCGIEVERSARTIKLSSIGASFSKIANFMDVSKTMVHKYIKNFQTKNSLIVTRVSYKKFLDSWKSYVKENFMLFYRWFDGRIEIHLKTASSYDPYNRNYKSIDIKYQRYSHLVSILDSPSQAHSKIVRDMG